MARRFFLLCMLISFEMTARCLIFDATNTIFVVLEKNFEKEIKKQGLGHSIAYVLKNWSTDIEHDFHEFLETLGTQHGSSASLVRGPDGKVLPSILVRWLSGTISYQQLLDTIESNTRQKIFVDIVRIAFDPAAIADNTVQAQGAFELVNKSIDLVQPANVVLLANWDQEAFSRIIRMQQHRQLMKFFAPDNVHSSGSLRMIQPRDSKQIFTNLASRYNCNLDDIIYVTSMPAHAEAARGLGVKTVLVRNHNLNAALDEISRIAKQ